MELNCDKNTLDIFLMATFIYLEFLVAIKQNNYHLLRMNFKIAQPFSNHAKIICMLNNVQIISVLFGNRWKMS